MSRFVVIFISCYLLTRCSVSPKNFVLLTLSQNKTVTPRDNPNLLIMNEKYTIKVRSYKKPVDEITCQKDDKKIKFSLKNVNESHDPYITKVIGTVTAAINGSWICWLYSNYEKQTEIQYKSFKLNINIRDSKDSNNLKNDKTSETKYKECNKKDNIHINNLTSEDLNTLCSDINNHKDLSLLPDIINTTGFPTLPSPNNKVSDTEICEPTELGAPELNNKDGQEDTGLMICIGVVNALIGMSVGVVAGIMYQRMRYRRTVELTRRPDEEQPIHEMDCTAPAEVSTRPPYPLPMEEENNYHYNTIYDHRLKRPVPQDALKGVPTVK